MSMVCKYRPLTADEARRVRGDEDYLMGLIAPEVDEPAEGGGGPVLDIHKSWHGLHWLLCQDARDGPEPLKHAVLGGEEIGEDLGYGRVSSMPRPCAPSLPPSLPSAATRCCNASIRRPWQRRTSTRSMPETRTGAGTSSTPSTASSASLATPPAAATAC